MGSKKNATSVRRTAQENAAHRQPMPDSKKKKRKKQSKTGATAPVVQLGAKPAPQPMMTLPEVCMYTRIPRSTFYQLLAEGQRPRAAKPGRSLLFKREWVDAWLEEMADRRVA